MPPPHLASLLRPAIDPAIVAQPASAPARKTSPRRQATWLRPAPTDIPKPLPLPLRAPEAPAPRAETRPIPSRPALPRLSLPRLPVRSLATARAAATETPRHQLVWLTALATLLLGPLAHAAGALGLPGSSADIGLLIGLPWAELPAAILYWGALLLPAVALATWRKAEPVTIVVVATFWAWSGLHHAAAHGWLPASVPPLPFG
ncbi:MAG: hypothetical protein K2X11_12660 [Acetobacteraceae bacterium]|nr:hypothetical protein [Acetobacteraceae bacterium]